MSADPIHFACEHCDELRQHTVRAFVQLMLADGEVKFRSADPKVHADFTLAFDALLRAHHEYNLHREHCQNCH